MCPFESQHSRIRFIPYDEKDKHDSENIQPTVAYSYCVRCSVYTAITDVKFIFILFRLQYDKTIN